MPESNPSPAAESSTDPLETNTDTDTHIDTTPSDLSVSELVVDSTADLSDLSDVATPPLTKRRGFGLGKVLGKVVSAAGTVGSVAAQAKDAIADTVTGAAVAVGTAASQTGGAIAGTVTGATGAVVDTVTGAAAAVGTAASQTGGAIVNTVTGTADAISQGAIKVTDTVTSVAGQTIDLLLNYPYLQPLTKPLRLDWLLPLIDQVDVVKAEERVKQLQQQYPQDTAGAIAHRIMVEKAIYVGGTGFASSFMPGFATALFAVDLAATMVLQAEMVYQIAAAHGLNLQDPSRKGEVVAIFALSFGGNAAIKAGLGFLRNAPVAGAVIGASSNAVMLYALGHAACQFYQLKVQPCLPAAVPDPVAAAAVDSGWVTIQTDSEAYLQANADQQVILDQIVVHLVLAGHPNQSIADLLPHLRSLNLQPATLEQLTVANFCLPPLSDLLVHLNPELGVSLLAQCQAIAQTDGVITVAEQQIIQQLDQALSPVLSESSAASQ